MAMVSTYCPQFTGLRRSCPKLETSSSPSQSLSQHVSSHLRLFSARKPSQSAAVAMASNNKVDDNLDLPLLLWIEIERLGF